MSDLEVRHCRVLVAVRDGGGVGAAARLLGVAQSTVSEALLSLERVLGAPVTVRRPGREAILTATAETLLPYARKLIAAADAAISAVADRRPNTVRLGTVESISSYLLPDPLRDFRRQWPELDVSVVVGLCAELRQRVDRGELDAALTVELPLAIGPESGREALVRVDLELVVSGEHAFAGRVVSRQDFGDRRLVLADSSGAFSDVIESWLGFPPRRAKLESAGSIDGVKRAIIDGDAIGLLPKYAVDRELTCGTLIGLTLDDPLPVASLFLTVGTTPLPPAISQLVTQVSRRHCQIDAAGAYRHR